MFSHKTTSIKVKIAGISIQLMVLSGLVTIVTILAQSHVLQRQMAEQVRAEAVSGASKIVQNLYLDCEAVEARNQKFLTHNLGIARELLGREGAVWLDTNYVTWTAVNQVTKEKQSVELPRMVAGAQWLGKNYAAGTNSPVVDEVRHLTQAHCTIFERMNEAGDMLRVDTSVLGTNGNRAVGTFISSRNADGSPNGVIAVVLKGDTFRGRAFVVDDYHAAAYEPIWNAGKTRVIGMLYVGMSMADINRDFRTTVQKIVVGRTGGVYVLGAKGDNRGRYVVPPKGASDGESAWETKDADGRLVVQEMVANGLAAGPTAIGEEYFSGTVAGEAAGAKKFAAFAYFPVWDWLIVAVGNEADFHSVLAAEEAAIARLIRWVGVAAFGIGLAGFILSFMLATSIVNSISRVISQVWSGSQQVASAAGQVSSSSQTLAHGAGQQASSIEETSASLEETSGLARQNAESAGQARDLSAQTLAAAEKCSQDMESMSRAMDAIQESSSGIAKIIKAIDEIAFQTNILALNAAVEAARAGDAGLGFAVVAEEVRTLAQRSAAAARETTAKIEDAVAKSSQGVLINKKIASSLSDIVQKARQVDEVATQVADTSRKQTEKLSQIHGSVEAVDRVTQANLAGSEESAAAAEELTAQAEMMKKSVRELMVLVGRLDLQTVEEERAGAVPRAAWSPAEPGKRRQMARQMRPERVAGTIA